MNIVSSLSLLLLIIFFSACSTLKPIAIYSASSTNIYISGTYSFDDDEASDITNLAIFIREASKVYNEDGIKYFKIINAEVPRVLINFESLVSYCYPDNAGYNPSDFEEKSTSLERKCKTFQALKLSGRVYQDDDNNLVIAFIGTKKLSMEESYWSVEEVLNSPIIDKYIEESLKESDKRPIEFRKHKDALSIYSQSFYYRMRYPEALFN